LKLWWTLCPGRCSGNSAGPPLALAVAATAAARLPVADGPVGTPWPRGHRQSACNGIVEVGEVWKGGPPRGQPCAPARWSHTWRFVRVSCARVRRVGHLPAPRWARWNRHRAPQRSGGVRDCGSVLLTGPTGATMANVWHCGIDGGCALAIGRHPWGGSEAKRSAPRRSLFSCRSPRAPARESAPLGSGADRNHSAAGVGPCGWGRCHGGRIQAPHSGGADPRRATRGAAGKRVRRGGSKTGGSGCRHTGVAKAPRAEPAPRARRSPRRHRPCRHALRQCSHRLLRRTLRGLAPPRPGPFPTSVRSGYCPPWPPLVSPPSVVFDAPPACSRPIRSATPACIPSLCRSRPCRQRPSAAAAARPPHHPAAGRRRRPRGGRGGGHGGVTAAAAGGARVVGGHPHRRRRGRPTRAPRRVGAARVRRDRQWRVRPPLCPPRPPAAAAPASTSAGGPP